MVVSEDDKSLYLTISRSEYAYSYKPHDYLKIF